MRACGERRSGRAPPPCGWATPPGEATRRTGVPGTRQPPGKERHVWRHTQTMRSVSVGSSCGLRAVCHPYGFLRAAAASIASTIAVAQELGDVAAIFLGNVGHPSSLRYHVVAPVNARCFQRRKLIRLLLSLGNARGTNAVTTADCAATPAISRDVPPVTHPPHAKPMIIAAIAPPMAPQRPSRSGTNDGAYLLGRPTREGDGVVDER